MVFEVGQCEPQPGKGCNDNFHLFSAFLFARENHHRTGNLGEPWGSLPTSSNYPVLKLIRYLDGLQKETEYTEPEDSKLE